MTCTFASTTSQHRPTRLATALASIALVLLTPLVARAGDAKSATIAVPLMTKALTDIAGKEVVMLTVQYAPGGSSAPHRHDAHVFVYVLEGSIVTQVDGQPPVTLKAGEAFYENPQDVHRQSANASKTEPAKFLVFYVKDQGKASSRPVS